MCFREGRSNAHIKGDYQRIGDVMLKNFQELKVRHHHVLHIRDHSNQLTLMHVCHVPTLSAAPDSEPA